MPTKNPHTTLAFVASVNGKISFEDNPNVKHWSSKEDQKHFEKLIKMHPIILLSSKTYETVKSEMHHQEGKCRIVMTRNPKKYAAERIPGQLEFTSKSPKRILNDLSKQSIKKVLLAGGSIFAHEFLKQKLVDSIVLTLEPKIFGTGTSLVTPLPLNIALKLKSMKRMNKAGTLLLEYEVER